MASRVLLAMPELTLGEFACASGDRLWDEVNDIGGGAPGGGRVDVHSGRSGRVLRTITSTTAGENLGFDTVGLGDVNRDHAPDLLVSARPDRPSTWWREPARGEVCNRGMRLAAALITSAILLAGPAAASAKEITKARACGTDGCVTMRDQAVLRGLMDGGPPTVPPATDGAAFRVTAEITEPGQGVIAHVHSWWVPSLRMLVGEDGTWMPLAPSTVSAFKRATADLTPIPGAKTGLAVAPPAPAAPPARDSGGGIPTWLLILVPIAVVAVAAAALLAWRRPRGDFPVPAP